MGEEPGGSDDFESSVAAVAALGDPTRRALYRFVVSAGSPVSRDQASAGVGVARHNAKFHLDKLVEDGLLAAEYRRPPGRGGPGAGRPAKLYRRADREIAVTLPERRYELAGRLFAQAILEAADEPRAVTKALTRVARRFGHDLAASVRARARGSAPSAPLALARAIAEELRDRGYEPRPEGAGIVLENCPFHALARDYRDLVCGMNLDLLAAMVKSIDGCPFEARLDPAPERCCVTLSRTR